MTHVVMRNSNPVIGGNGTTEQTCVREGEENDGEVLVGQRKQSGASPSSLPGYPQNIPS